MYNKILLCIGILMLFLGCGRTENALKENFSKITNYEGLDDLLNNIDQGSHDYLSKIADLANTNDYASISSFCSKQKFPISTKYLIQIMSKMANPENQMDKKNGLLTMALTNMGPVGLDSKNQYSFHELESSSGNSATAVVNYLVQRKPKVSIQSKVLFSQEDGQWKLNLPSTLSYMEKYYNKLWRQRGGTEEAFIQSIIDQGGGAVQFQYRMDRATVK